MVKKLAYIFPVENNEQEMEGGFKMPIKDRPASLSHSNVKGG